MLDNINIINPFNNSLVKNMEIEHIKNLLGINTLTSIPGTVMTTIKDIMTTNYIALGTEVIKNITTNKKLHAKLKELGFELYGMAGDSALFITEEHDEQLKTFREKTSYIGNF